MPASVAVFAMPRIPVELESEVVLAVAEAAEDVIQDTVRLYPDALVSDVLTGMLLSIRRLGAAHGIAIAQVSQAWLEVNEIRVH